MHFIYLFILKLFSLYFSRNQLNQNLSKQTARRECPDPNRIPSREGISKGRCEEGQWSIRLLTNPIDRTLLLFCGRRLPPPTPFSPNKGFHRVHSPPHQSPPPSRGVGGSGGAKKERYFVAFFSFFGVFCPSVAPAYLPWIGSCPIGASWSLGRVVLEIWLLSSCCDGSFGLLQDLCWRIFFLLVAVLWSFV